MRQLFRARFHANYEDSRPVNFPVEYPWWESGFAADESYSVCVSYCDSEEYILKNWPEATQIDMEPVDEITFSDRFPKPDWYEPKERCE